MSPIFLSDAETDKQNEEYKRCIEQYPCKHDDKQLKDVPDDEQHEVYHCRAKRHYKCVLRPEEE
jgi:hypothetical protein